jgi:hypothetical protein
MGDAMPTLAAKTLGELVLPGTHDSGSFNLTKEVVEGVTSEFYRDVIEIAEGLGVPIWDFTVPWALAQDYDVYMQLVGGIRYIDLRCGWDHITQQWRTFHF